VLDAVWQAAKGTGVRRLLGVCIGSTAPVIRVAKRRFFRPLADRAPEPETRRVWGSTAARSQRVRHRAMACLEDDAAGGKDRGAARVPASYFVTVRYLCGLFAACVRAQADNGQVLEWWIITDLQRTTFNRRLTMIRSESMKDSNDSENRISSSRNGSFMAACEIDFDILRFMIRQFAVQTDCGFSTAL